MSVKWSSKTQKFDLKDLFARIEKSQIVNSDGRHGFTMTADYEDSRIVLESLVELDSNLPRRINSSLISSAIAKASEAGELNQKGFIKHLRIREQQYLAKKSKRYHLFTQISASRSLEIDSVRLGNTNFSFPLNIPKAHSLSANQERIQRNWWRARIKPTSWRHAIVSAIGKSEAEAGRKALDQIEFLLGIWNFALNRNVISNISFVNAVRSPVNKLVTGPIYYLVEKNKSVSTDIFWHNPDFIEPIKPLASEKKWNHAKRAEVVVKTNLSSHRYKSDIKKMFMRYNNALDEVNYDSCFLKLWSLLELLTWTVGDRYDVTIRRASIYWQDTRFHRQVLNNLRHLRNDNVHHARSDQDPEKLIYQLKRYVDALIGYHLFNHMKFNSIAESCQFLDLSTDKRTLRRQIKIREYAIEFFK